MFPPAGRRHRITRPTWWQRHHLDLPLIFSLLVVSLLGLALLYSASGQNTQLVARQAVWLLLGFVLMGLMANLSAYTIGRWGVIFYVLGVLSILAVELFGVNVKGAQRWLDLPGLPRVQPSEMMKWVLPLMLAWYLSRRPLPPDLRRVAASFVLLLVPVLLVAFQPDLGTATLLLLSGLCVLFLAGWPLRQILCLGGIGVLSAPLLWRFFLYDYQKQRILTAFNPEGDVLGAGWSVIQSKSAVGSGGVWGKGWLHGTQSQLDFLPEGHTDFIAAVLAEEFGLVGILVLLGVYIVIVGRGIFLSVGAPDSFGRLFGSALMFIFSAFVLINMAMVAGLLPVVGVPLPLVSRGGSALISMLIGFGILMSVCSRSNRL